MSHDHHDHRSLGITSLNKAFVIGIVLNAGFVVAEFIAGFWYNSLGLISDAGHNLGDVFSLVLAMLAFRLAKVSPTLRYKYDSGFSAECSYFVGRCRIYFGGEYR